MTRPRAAAAWVAAAVAIVLATGWSEKPSPEAAALADVIRGAQTAELNLETVPAGYHGPGSSAELMQPVLDHVPTELAKYYAGTLLTRKVTQHQNGIRQMAEAGGGRRIGGVRTLALRVVWVSGATATPGKSTGSTGSSRQVEAPEGLSLRRAAGAPHNRWPSPVRGCGRAHPWPAAQSG